MHICQLGAIKNLFINNVNVNVMDMKKARDKKNFYIHFDEQKKD